MPFRKACASGAPPCCAVCEQKSLPPESLRKDFERDQNESQSNRRLSLSHGLFTHKMWLSHSASLPDLVIRLDSGKTRQGAARLSRRVGRNLLSSETCAKSWLILGREANASSGMAVLGIGADAERTIDESDFRVRTSFSRKCDESRFPVQEQGVDRSITQRGARSSMHARPPRPRGKPCARLSLCPVLAHYRGLDWKRRASMTEVPTMVRTEMR